MTYNEDWDRLLNPFRYDGEGNLTAAGRKQDARMRLDSAGGSGHGGGSGDLNVEIPALDSASDRAYELMGRFGDGARLADVPNYAAVNSLKAESFQLGSALDEVIATWDTRVGHLVSAFASLQNALWCHARGMEVVEAENADTMNDYMKHYK